MDATHNHYTVGFGTRYENKDTWIKVLNHDYWCRGCRWCCLISLWGDTEWLKNTNHTLKIKEYMTEIIGSKCPET